VLSIGVSSRLCHMNLVVALRRQDTRIAISRETDGKADQGQNAMSAEELGRPNSRALEYCRRRYHWRSG
jgi:hypothetical protein